VAVLVWKDLPIRLAWLGPALPVRAFEAPGALGADCPAILADPSEAGWNTPRRMAAPWA
jgi:hypothetical protein